MLSSALSRIWFVISYNACISDISQTVGKDVSGLFPDVLKNMQTEDLEQKKLVYLYLMNYAKTQPELVILAVNTFVKVGEAIGSYLSLNNT